MMKISIIVPVFNEETTVLSTLDMLEGLQGDKEIIFVDGGSTDLTIDLISNRAAVIQSVRGRARQMNAGALASCGEVLLFLHCDSKVSKDVLVHITKCFEDLRVVGGGLSLEIDDPALIFKLISYGSNLRPKMSGIFFGDQGIFVRRDVFDKIGGFPDITLMEDWEFSRKLKREGLTVQLPAKILTSARRWHQFGIWETIKLMHKIKLLYLLGASPEELNRIYRDAR